MALPDKAPVRIVIALAVQKQLLIEHLDITGAYLHEDYNHLYPVFLWQPKRFEGTYKHPERAGRLLANVYGTPAAANIYMSALQQHLQRHGCDQLQSNTSLFFRTEESKYIIIVINMDDFMVAGNLQRLLDEFYEILSQKYSVKLLGKPSTYLNRTFNYIEGGSILVSQPSLTDQIIHNMNMAHANPSYTSYPCGIDLDPPHESDEQLSTQRRKLFQETIGELWYLGDCTRFDLAYITAKLARATKSPTARHWNIVKHVIRYLIHTRTHGLMYYSSPACNQLVTFSDADYGNEKSNRKSYIGNIRVYAGTPVGWLSKQQGTLALSTCEAEYITGARAAQDKIWLHNVLTELCQITDNPVTLVDNSAAVKIANSQGPNTENTSTQGITCSSIT